MSRIKPVKLSTQNVKKNYNQTKVLNLSLKSLSIGIIVNLSYCSSTGVILILESLVPFQVQ